MLNEVTYVKTAGKEIFLVGTAHISQESIALVEKTISEQSPDTVAVELDAQRYDSILNKKKWDETEIHKVIKEKKTYLFLMQLFLTNFQRKLGDQVGVKPGAEMLKAIEVANKKEIPLALIDRDIGITLKRAFKTMGLTEKLSLFYGFISGIFEKEEIDEDLMEKLKDNDIMNEMLEELSREIPSIKKVLIDERDTYLANSILAEKGEKIVAVVGAGHVTGIKKIIESDKRTGLKEISEVPKTKAAYKLIPYVFPLLFLAIVAWGFYTSGTQLTIELFKKWFLINGVLSGLGAAIALGHPLSILVALIAAPITSLNPTIAAGWFAGLTEAWIRKPRVKDFDNLFALNGITDYWKNGVTRILLVIIFANLGSMAGTFIALPYLATLL